MHFGILCPLPKSLSIEPENDSTETKEEDQTHIRHDWGNVSILDNPRSDKLREAVTPDVLIDRDRDED
jgi:hypothetical protein